MRNQSAWKLIGIATLLSLIYGALIGAARWGGIGLILGALIGGGLTIVFVWIVGILLIALFSVLRGQSQASDFEVERTSGTALLIAPLIIIFIDILGIYFNLNR